jgi:hypothetical protein
MRSRLALSLALLASFAARDALAQSTQSPSEARCLSAYEQGQRLRKKHALKDARAELLTCAREPCPQAFRPECTQWLEEVARLVPSIVLRAQGDGDVTDVTVSIDGIVVTTRLDGTALELDPGEHTLRFVADGRAPVEQKVLVVEGEKTRIISVTLPPIATNEVRPAARATVPGPAEPTRSVPTASWILGGLGVVALGSFAYFGATALSQRGKLEACDPNCRQEDIDDTRTRLLVADISLGVSIVSLGVATILWLATPKSTKSTALRGVLSGTF